MAHSKKKKEAFSEKGIIKKKALGEVCKCRKRKSMRERENKLFL